MYLVILLPLANDSISFQDSELRSIPAQTDLLFTSWSWPEDRSVYS